MRLGLRWLGLRQLGLRELKVIQFRLVGSRVFAPLIYSNNCSKNEKLSTNEIKTNSFLLEKNGTIKYPEVGIHQPCSEIQALQLRCLLYISTKLSCECQLLEVVLKKDFFFTKKKKDKIK